MKELHNHIFSNTTCISKETMLRYINKQLSKKELYEVEKHMLDCELCTEAYEGMKYAQNSSMLFAIDSQIDQRVGGGNYKAPVMRNLMVAASILVIVFGAYFTFNYFNNTVNDELGLAYNNDKEPKQEESIEKSKNLERLEEQEVIDTQKNIVTINNELSDDKWGEDEDKEVAPVFDVSPIVAEQAPVEDMELSNDYADEMEVAEEEVMVTLNQVDETMAKGESGKMELDDINTTDVDNRRDNNFDATVQSESSEANFSYVQPETTGSVESLKKEDKKVKVKARKTSGNKKRAKANTSNNAPQYYENGKLAETPSSLDRNQQKTVTIDSYKVVDYTDEYQKEYDLKNAATIETKSVSAGFENKADKDVAEKEREETTVEITYKETLEKAIKLYKNKKYNEAIEQFNIILAEHPDEVNGWFYGGLSDYHLKRYKSADGKFGKVLTNKQTEFNEEAKWYKALTLIELKQHDHAKKILKEIVNTGGFYKEKAVEKLKEF